MRRSYSKFLNWFLLPFINVVAALFVSSLIVLLLGEDPWQMMKVLVHGAFGYDQAIGYTLYYATNFIFTGLAVAVAYHCGLLNIGGEGQLYLGGLAVAIACMTLAGYPWPWVFVLAFVLVIVFSGGWALIPAVLQAKRGSHIVITTIMFNFIAASLMTYVIVRVLSVPGMQAPESAPFDPSTHLPEWHEILASWGIKIASSPVNLTLVLALLACVFVWWFIWRTKWGYEMRVVGTNEKAARYGGISISKNIVMAMVISGTLAGLAALNIVMGEQNRLIASFPGGFGFVGIAVAFMGRHHPVGIVLAAILFGALYQGGADLSFEMPRIDKDIIIVVQGVVVLFFGALENIFREPLERRFQKLSLAQSTPGPVSQSTSAPMKD